MEFHFVLLGVGEALKEKNYVTPQSLQDFLADTDMFGSRVRVPLGDCRLALLLMEYSGFIEKTNSFGEDAVWSWKERKQGFV